MAIRFTYSITVAFEEDQLDNIRAEATKRLPDAEEAWDGDVDLNTLEGCARALLGDPIDAIVGGLECQEASFGVDAAEAGVEFSYPRPAPTK